MDSKLFRILNVTQSPPSQSVLVVEHEDQLRRLIVLILKQAGYLVEEARNGEEGLSKWNAGHFDLVVSDIQMPCMTGVEMILKLGLAMSPAGGSWS